MNLSFLTGHESFYLREGWLKKSLDVLVEQPDIFQAKKLKDAINRLGVGANMVKSMRYWLELCGLIEKDKDTFKLTHIADALVKHDPYFQNINTLWILHANIAQKLPVWQFVFVENDLPVFDKAFMHKMMESRLKELGRKASKKTILDSSSVFINTYIENKVAVDPENNIRSPFSKLKLVKHHEGRFVFRIISHRDYSPYLVYYLSLFPKDIKQVPQEDIFRALRKIMNVELSSLRKSLDYLENKEIIHIDRAAGLNNVVKQKQMRIDTVIKSMLMGSNLK